MTESPQRSWTAILEIVLIFKLIIKSVKYYKIYKIPHHVHGAGVQALLAVICGVLVEEDVVLVGDLRLPITWC